MDTKTRRPYPTREERISVIDSKIVSLQSLIEDRKKLIAKSEAKLNERKAAMAKNEAMLEKLTKLKERLTTPKEKVVRPKRSPEEIAEIRKANIAKARESRKANAARIANLEKILSEKGITLDEVIDRARNIDAYELESSAYAEPDFYKLYLMHHLETRFDPKWLDGIVSNDTEQELLRRLNAAVTDYGIVSSKNQPLYRIVPYDEPEKYELIEILGHPALFSNGRISHSDLPDGLYQYDLRSGDETDFVTLEKNVAVNHAGTVILKEPLDFGDRDYIPLDEDSSPNFTGEELDLEEFQQTNFSEDQNMKMGGM